MRPPALDPEDLLPLISSDLLSQELRRRGYRVTDPNAQLTAPELARLLPFSVHYIRELTQTGQIPHIRYGHRTVRYRLSDITDWMQRRAHPALIRPSSRRTRAQLSRTEADRLFNDARRRVTGR